MTNGKIPANPILLVRVAIAMVLSDPSNHTLSESKNQSLSGLCSGISPAILITKRKIDTPYGGYWEFPGGKAESGESIPDAARRECLEELGIHIRIDATLPPIVHAYEHATVQLHACIARMSDPTEPIRHLAVSEHRWATLEQLPWLEFLPANVRLVTRLIRWLETHPAAR